MLRMGVGRPPRRRKRVMSWWGLAIRERFAFMTGQCFALSALLTTRTRLTFSRGGDVRGKSGIGFGTTGAKTVTLLLSRFSGPVSMGLTTTSLR
jgi:hypothetical protein